MKLAGTISSTETQVIRASKSGNFIFYSKGWGYGVGLSQIGFAPRERYSQNIIRRRDQS